MRWLVDSDGQHPAECIPAFMLKASSAAPGLPGFGRSVSLFDGSAPGLRVKGRKISNWWANLETLWAGIHDSLFGFRVYPIGPLIGVMRRQPWMRRFDFDVEAVVRLCWRGVKPVNLYGARALLYAGGWRHLTFQLIGATMHC